MSEMILLKCPLCGNLHVQILKRRDKDHICGECWMKERKKVKLMDCGLINIVRRGETMTAKDVIEKVKSVYIRELLDLIAEQKKQLLSEKKTCKWFYERGLYRHIEEDNNDEYFEEQWQIHISSMPEDIEKRRSQKK